MSESDILLADPPIDDDSYRQEAYSFPSDEQRQLMFMSYGISSGISRIVEASMTLLLILTFEDNLVPVSLYCIAGVIGTIYLDKLMHVLARWFTSRLKLLTVAIVQQRIAAFTFLSLIIAFNKNKFNGLFANAVGLVLVVLATVWVRASLYLYQRTFSADWLMALASTQERIRYRFKTIMRGISLLILMLFPIFLGALAEVYTVEQISYLLIYLSALGLLVEPNLLYKLYRTCYALYLPRNTGSLDFVDYDSGNDLRNLVGIWQPPAPNTVSSPYSFWTGANSAPQNGLGYYIPQQPFSRAYKYLKRRSVPVAITMATLLITSASLVMIQPVTGWFFIVQGMSPVSMYVIKMAQALLTLHPALPAPFSFVLSASGALAALPLLYFSLHSSYGLFWTYCFAISILVNRAGSPTIALVGDEFVKEYLVDEEILKVYQENMTWLRINSELVLQALTIVWSRKQDFFWPIFISSALNIVGIGVMLTVIKRHWSEIQR